MNKMSFYNMAREKIIDFSSKDPAAIIAREQGVLGLTRILMCMESLGLDSSDVFLVALPDFTYTRNMSRWNAGFPYGCIITLGKTNPLFIPIDFRPNCCGVIFVKIQGSIGDGINYVKKYHEFINRNDEIAKTDFNRRNHFIGIYEDKLTGEYYGLIHGSFAFIKKAMYSEHNERLYQITKKQQILGSQFLYLQGKEAEEYYNEYMCMEKKSIEYRRQIAEYIFTDCKIIFHGIHEGFHGKNTILLGAYASCIPFEYPMMLSPEMNLPIVLSNIPVELGKNKFFCAPHGGGYGLSNVQSAEHMENEYLLKFGNGSKMITNNIIDMPFYYRNNVDEVWCSEYRMGMPKQELVPIYNFKV